MIVLRHNTLGQYAESVGERLGQLGCSPAHVVQAKVRLLEHTNTREILQDAVSGRTATLYTRPDEILQPWQIPHWK